MSDPCNLDDLKGGLEMSTLGTESVSLNDWYKTHSATLIDPVKPFPSIVIPNEAINAAIEITTNSIFRVRAQALVVPTDKELSGSAGISRQLYQIYGPEYHKYCQRAVGPYGFFGTRAHYTKVPTWNPGNPDIPRQRKYIIHTKGPSLEPPKPRPSRCHDSVFQEELGNCYFNSIQSAVAHRAKSVVIPAIATGFRGADPLMATETALRTIRYYLERSYMDYLKKENEIDALSCGGSDPGAWVLVTDEGHEDTGFKPIKIILSIPHNASLQRAYIDCLRFYFPPMSRSSSIPSSLSFPSFPFHWPVSKLAPALVLPSMFLKPDNTPLIPPNEKDPRLDFYFEVETSYGSRHSSRISIISNRSEVKHLRRFELSRRVLVAAMDHYRNPKPVDPEHQMTQQKFIIRYNLLALALDGFQKSPEFNSLLRVYNPTRFGPPILKVSANAPSQDTLDIKADNGNDDSKENNAGSPSDQDMSVEENEKSVVIDGKDLVEIKTEPMEDIDDSFERALQRARTLTPQERMDELNKTLALCASFPFVLSDWDTAADLKRSIKNLDSCLSKSVLDPKRHTSFYSKWNKITATTRLLFDEPAAMT